MYVTTPQVTVKNEYHTKVGNGGYAAIGTQSGLHVGQSAVTPTGLVYDLIISHLWRHVYFSLLFFSFVKFRNLEAVVGGMFMRVWNELNCNRNFLKFKQVFPFSLYEV